MKSMICGAGMLLFSLCVLAGGVPAQENAEGGTAAPPPAAVPPQEEADTPARSAVHMPVYVPPLRGAPVARVGGGTHGSGDGLPYVSVVTPEDTGCTSTSQPVRYWYLSEPVDTRFEFALINDNQIEPVIELTSDKPMKKGPNSLNLADHGVSLKPGIIYQWPVALVTRPEQHSSDIVSSGTIELVPPGPDQAAALRAAGTLDAVTLYARSGYWYDAFTGLSRLIDAHSEDRDLLAMRRSLLQQVGLETVADAEP